jgi:hypothetical protein
VGINPPRCAFAVLAGYYLVTRLPQVHAAMDAGVLDEPRARVFSEWTIEPSPEQAGAVCAELLPRAPKLTTGQLIEQIKKLAIAVDPDWARRRYEQAVADRKVVGIAMRMGQRTYPGITCRWIEWLRPAGTSMRWRKP